MNGQDIHTYNKYSRRDFIKRTGTFIALLPFLDGCVSERVVPGKIIDDNSKAGHLLRDKIKLTPSKIIEVPILIIGSGVSGLTAGYQLTKNALNEFYILDLAKEYGGNSVSGTNSVSAYPWAAHYLPIVNNNNKRLIDFLKSHQIITSIENDVPAYDEYYLCFDPEERLFINGHWQDGLVPSLGVSAGEKEEISRFFKIVHDYKFRAGSDGKYAFEIPVANSSTDKEFRDLDLISFSDFLSQHDFSSKHLLWYLEYCCRDDYGSTLDDTSAYAGLHYFCARRAKASNAESSAVLTWQEGNAFLVKKLHDTINERTQGNRIKTGQLVFNVSIQENKVEALVLDTTTNECVKYICDHLVSAVPQYINNRILSEELKSQRQKNISFDYTPWIVANITVNKLNEYEGEPLSWDNVMYGSPSLGYVNACHQHLNRNHSKLVLTYYLPLTGKNISEARQEARTKTHQEICKLIIDDLKQAHKDIDKHITNIDVKVWGHGMIKPKPGFIFSEELKKTGEPIEEKIFFAHTDLSGISIFEEAFEQGMNAAEKIIEIHARTTKA
jgi:protoporphyrinogen oxidase